MLNVHIIKSYDSNINQMAADDLVLEFHAQDLNTSTTVYTQLTEVVGVIPLNLGSVASTLNTTGAVTEVASPNGRILQVTVATSNTGEGSSSRVEAFALVGRIGSRRADAYV